MFLDSIFKWEVGRADFSELEFRQASTMKGRRGNTTVGAGGCARAMNGRCRRKVRAIGVEAGRGPGGAEKILSANTGITVWGASKAGSLSCCLPT